MVGVCMSEWGRADISLERLGLLEIVQDCVAEVGVRAQKLDRLPNHRTMPSGLTLHKSAQQMHPRAGCSLVLETERRLT